MWIGVSVRYVKAVSLCPSALPLDSFPAISDPMNPYFPSAHFPFFFLALLGLAADFETSKGTTGFFFSYLLTLSPLPPFVAIFVRRDYGMLGSASIVRRFADDFILSFQENEMMGSRSRYLVCLDGSTTRGTRSRKEVRYTIPVFSLYPSRFVEDPHEFYGKTRSFTFFFLELVGVGKQDDHRVFVLIGQPFPPMLVDIDRSFSPPPSQRRRWPAHAEPSAAVSTHMHFPAAFFPSFSSGQKRRLLPPGRSCTLGSWFLVLSSSTSLWMKGSDSSPLFSKELSFFFLSHFSHKSAPLVQACASFESPRTFLPVQLPCCCLLKLRPLLRATRDVSAASLSFTTSRASIR